MRRSGHAEFSLPRSGQGHTQFNSIDCYGHNAAFFGTFLGSKKVPFFSSSLLTQRQHHFAARSGQSDRLRIVPLIAGGGMQHMHLIGIGCAGEGGHAVRARNRRSKAEGIRADVDHHACDRRAIRIDKTQGIGGFLGRFLGRIGCVIFKIAPGCAEALAHLIHKRRVGKV